MAINQTQREKAERLRALHRAAQPLLLVNAWDVVSARIIEALGFPAVATTSAGIAWVEGFADGEQISRAHMLERVARIAAAVSIPVTADLEGAYGATLEDAAVTARGALEAGAAGLNFEDTHHGGNALTDLKFQVSRIAAMCEEATKLGVPLVINARTDVFLAKVGDNDQWRLAEATRRCNRFLEAGADCAFVPGVTDEVTIRALVASVRGPLNVLAGAATPAVKRLAELGVARVSVGSGAMGYVLAQFRDIAVRARDGESFDWVARRIPHAELNALLE